MRRELLLVAAYLAALAVLTAALVRWIARPAG
jgi:hypothetical protein